MSYKQLNTLVLIALTGACPFAAGQDDQTNQETLSGFYAGGSLGYARGEVGASEMNARMDQLGYEANARVSGQNRMAWSLTGGYRWNTYVETQFSYTDLGEVRTRLTGVAADINDYLNSANLIHPRSGSGYEFTLLGRYPLVNNFYVYGRVGIFKVDSVYRATSNINTAGRQYDENNEFYGAGLGKTLNRHWDLRLGVDSYSLEGETIPVMGLGAIYKFGTTKRSTQPTAKSVLTATETAAQPEQKVTSPVPTTDKVHSITLAILFDTDSAELKETFMPEVTRLADYLREHPEMHVRLEGHTDDRGSASHNESLATRRVKAVQAALITQGAIAAERISVIGYGEQQPIADNNTTEGQQANRRVVAVIN